MENWVNISIIFLKLVLKVPKLLQRLVTIILRGKVIKVGYFVYLRRSQVQLPILPSTVESPWYVFIHYSVLCLRFHPLCATFLYLSDSFQSVSWSIHRWHYRPTKQCKFSISTYSSQITYSNVRHKIDHITLN